MRTPLLRSITAATFALCLVTGSAAAQGKGHGKGQEKGQEKGHEKGQEKGEEHDQEMDREQGHDRKKESDRHRDHNDGDVRYPVASGSRHEDRDEHRRMPPGLAKKGGLPPGQAKKMYRATDGVVALRDVFGRHGYTVVRTQPYGNSQYVYYRLGNGLVQRAVITPGTDRLAFQNVPQLLLQEVLSRLY